MSEALARLLKPQIVRRCRCRELQVVRRSHQPGFCKITSSITFFWTTDVADPVKCGAMGQTFHHTCAYDLWSCSSAPKICSWKPWRPTHMGPMPTSSAFKAVARPSGGDARGVAGAVHADALQQWRQTAP